MVSMLNLLSAWSSYGEHAQFMVRIHNLWSSCSIYGQHDQFMVSMLNLGRTCSIHGEHAQFMVSMLNLWWACSISGEHAQFMLPQNDSLIVQIHPVDQKIQWYWFWSQLICTVTADLASQLDWPWKPTPKWLLECPNPSGGSKDSVILIFKSAD